MSDSVFSLVFFIPAALLVAFIIYNSCFKRLTTLDSNLESDEILDQARQAAA